MERITQKTHREGEGISLFDSTMINTPDTYHTYWTAARKPGFIIKHSPSTTNKAYLEHSDVWGQLCFPGRYQKPAFTLCQPLRSLTNWVFHTHNKRDIVMLNLLASTYRTSQRDRTILADHYHQLCSPCKSHRGFIPQQLWVNWKKQNFLSIHSVIIHLFLCWRILCLPKWADRRVNCNLSWIQLRKK